MIYVNVTEFRRHFGKYIDLVGNKKETIRLVKYGKWICTLVPYIEKKKRQ